jgi:hypothetical protein
VREVKEQEIKNRGLREREKEIKRLREREENAWAINLTFKDIV